MSPIRNLRWYIGGLLFLSTVINYIDRQTLSVLAPYLKVEYQVSRPVFFRMVAQYDIQWRDSLRDDSRTNYPILIRGDEQSAFGPAKLGRSLNCRSRFRSWPVVILNPGPLLAITNGFKTTFHHGRLMVPKMVNRCRISNELRPNSPDKS